MNAFIIECPNRPGEVARISEACAGRGVNISSIGSVAWGEQGAIGILTSDEARTREALEGAGCTFREAEVVEFALANRPGTLAEASRNLANAGVNIEFLTFTGMRDGDVLAAAAVDNVPAARQALSQFASAPA